jgi:hypothetical protein
MPIKRVVTLFIVYDLNFAYQFEKNVCPGIRVVSFLQFHYTQTAALP